MKIDNEKLFGEVYRKISRYKNLIESCTRIQPSSLYFEMVFGWEEWVLGLCVHVAMS